MFEQFKVISVLPQDKAYSLFDLFCYYFLKQKPKMSK